MMKLLLDKIEIENKQSMVTELATRSVSFIQNKNDRYRALSPCIPATLGFKLNHLRYAFIEDVKTEESARIATLLRNYGTISRDLWIFLHSLFS